MVRPQGNKRVSKIDTYLNCAEVFAYRSTCIKRKYGAVIVKDDIVISTGYNGAPRGFENCCDLGRCPRIERNMHQGDGYGICHAVHAEANALLNCSRQQTIGADLYLVGVNPEDNSIHKAKPCPLCARMIIQAGINNVYLRVGEGADNYMVVSAKELEWVQNADFPFEDKTNTATFVCCHVLDKKRPILRVTHDEDGYWQFLCGDTHTEEQARIIPLMEAYNLDKRVGQVANMECGQSAERVDINSDWITSFS